MKPKIKAIIWIIVGIVGIVLGIIKTDVFYQILAIIGGLLVLIGMYLFIKQQDISKKPVEPTSKEEVSEEKEDVVEASFKEDEETKEEEDIEDVEPIKESNEEKR